MITDATHAYLDGNGTPEQQQVFQDAAEQIGAAYDARYPDSPEDKADMIADQLVGAARYALEDSTLPDLRALRAQTRGACIAAVLAGTPKIEVATAAGITRATLDKWLAQ